jgi:hypothetical protein
MYSSKYYFRIKFQKDFPTWKSLDRKPTTPLYTPTLEVLARIGKWLNLECYLAQAPKP